MTGLSETTHAEGYDLTCPRPSHRGLADEEIGFAQKAMEWKILRTRRRFILPMIAMMS